MPANKYALLRYRIIDRTIRNKGRAYPSKEDLRHACEEALYGSDGERISISTIDKDIWAMRNESELGYYAPIKFSKEYGGYSYEDPNYTIAEVPLNDEDLNAIRAAAETLFQFKEIPLFKQFDSAIEKIMDRMKISAVDTDKKEKEIIRFQHVEGYRGSEFLEPLFRACSEKVMVILAYQKFGAESTADYRFAPYILKEYRNRWYVIGGDEEKSGIRTFALDRIQDVEVLNEKQERNVDFDAPQFFEHAVGITVTDAKPERVKLTFSESFAPYIITQPIHPSQTAQHLESGDVQVSIEVQVSVELVSTILGFGDAVKVESPELIQEKVKQALRSCLKKYGEV